MTKPSVEPKIVENRQATYSQQIAAALNEAFAARQVVTKVGLRKADGLLYVALESVADTAADGQTIQSSELLLALLKTTLKRLKPKLKLEWVKLVKASGRLSAQAQPLWKEDLLLFAAPAIAKSLTRPPVQNDASSDASSDVRINIGGDLHGQLIVGDGNQLHSYSYSVEHGGVLNVAAPPKIQPRPVPLALKPKPFTNLLDRKTVLPLIKETLAQTLPVEVYAKPGVGKTSLVRHVAHLAEVTDAFADGVVYLPATHQLAADLLQSLYDAFYEALPAFKPSYGQIQQALQEKAALVMLTGLSLDKAEMEWLIAALPKCTFLMVSDERVYWREGAGVALPGLPVEDAIALIQQDLGRVLADAEKVAVRSLCNALSGNPLQLRRAAAQVQAQNEPLDRWLATMQAQQRDSAAAQSGFDSADLAKTQLDRCIFTQAANNLSAKQKRCLALMGAMGGVALTVEEAQAISKLPDAAETLSELSNLHLIESTDAGFQLCMDLVEAVPQTFEMTPFLQSATDYFASGLAEGASHNSEAMLHLLEWTQKTGQWQRSMALAEGLDAPLSMAGQWQQWEQVLTQSLQAAQQAGNGKAEAWALHQLGTKAIATGNPTQAATWLSRAVGLREQLGDLAGAAVSRHNLGLILPPLVVGQNAGTPPPPPTGALTGSIAGKLAAIGAVVGSLAVGGIGIALWLGSPSPEPVVNVNNDDTALIDPVTVPLEDPAQPSYSFEPQTLTFDDISMGQQTRKSVKITNSGRTPLVIQSVETKGEEDFAVVGQTCGAPILPGESCAVEILFEPRGGGDRTAQLVLNSNTNNNTPLPIKGIGITRTAVVEPTPTPTAAPTPTPDPVSTTTPPKPDSEPSTTPPEPEPTTPPKSEPDASTAPSPDPDPPTPPEPKPEPSAPPEPEPPEPEPPESEPPAPEPPAPEPPAPEPPAPNTPPVVQDVDLSLEQGEPYTFNLLQASQAYDTDPEDTVAVLDVSNIDEIGGRMQNNGDGTVTYYPYAVPEDQYGRYTNNFAFTVADSQGETATGTIRIMVTVPIPEEGPI
ncbi:MAG: choice-of-anchor D domain-containing protein [Cyanobacteria bacterium J06598_1]